MSKTPRKFNGQTVCILLIILVNGTIESMIAYKLMFLYIDQLFINTVVDDQLHIIKQSCCHIVFNITILSITG